ncbi:MAG: sigma-54 dependent transcriptional regulator [Mariprofundales bacterium]|nr:sigma-54 dependent transcriptional regulator [Mariprofundales bacterium]
MAEVLLVDDEANARLVMSLNLQQRGHVVSECASAAAAKQMLAQRDFDVVVTDLRMEQADSGLEVVRAVHQYHPATRVLLLTAYASADTAVRAMKSGAFDYLTKPVSAEELAEAIERALLDALAVGSKVDGDGVADAAADATGTLIGESLAMQRVRERIVRAAMRDFTVLITGESGTGKELSARAIHLASARAEQPFVPVHCAAIPEGLFESELFGHCKGAFTGADHDQVGLVEAADSGTLFLDEIGEMPLSVQVKMLRVLQEHRVRRVGTQQEKTVDVRVIAATNRDLDAEVKRGMFREDLFYRLNVLPLHLPSLRQRREDLPALIAAILPRIGGEGLILPPDLLQQITQLPLMGNVRELENLLQRLVAFSDDGVIDASLMDEFYGQADAADHSLETLQKSGKDLDAWMARIERTLLQQALDATGGNATKAAKLLGISFRSIRYRLQKLFP